MRARLIEEIGTRAYLRVYWGDECPREPTRGYHDGKILLAESKIIRDTKLGGEPINYSDKVWPNSCSACGTEVPEKYKKQVFRRKLFNTESGDPEPGDLYYSDQYKRTADRGCVFHDNCDGVHMFAILPNGEHWDIDGRASNCSLRTDRLHRCWIRSGKPPFITVSKRGNSCSAGAGSIAAGSYHGFLKAGFFT